MNTNDVKITTLYKVGCFTLYVFKWFGSSPHDYLRKKKTVKWTYTCIIEECKESLGLHWTLHFFNIIWKLFHVGIAPCALYDSVVSISINYDWRLRCRYACLLYCSSLFSHSYLTQGWQNCFSKQRAFPNRHWNKWTF